MKKESIVDFYLRHVQEAIATYGERTIVFLESGHFMELYDHVSEQESPHLRICADILHIVVTRRDKQDIHSDYMAGIPTHSLLRYQMKLLKENYTIVMITQTTPPPRVERKITQILSPGCLDVVTEDSLTPQSSSILVCLGIETLTSTSVLLSIVSLQQETGHIQYISTQLTFTPQDPQELYDKIRDLFLQFFPMSFHEILILCFSTETSTWITSTLSEFIQGTDLTSKLYHIIPYSQDIHNMDTLVVQTHYLTKYFGQSYLALGSTIQESLGIEKLDSNTVVSLIYLLSFVEKHNVSLITHVQCPLPYPSMATSSVLQFYNQALEQLQIFPTTGAGNNSRKESLFDYLNATQTAPGARLLYRKLASPSTDPKELEDSYACISTLLEQPPPDSSTLLSSMDDWERMIRKWQLRKFSTISSLSKAVGVFIQKVETLHSLLTTYQYLHPYRAFERLDAFFLTQLHDILALLHTQFDMTPVRHHCFQRGIHPTLDAYEDTLCRIERELDHPQLLYKPELGFYLEFTKSKWKKSPLSQCEEYHIISDTSTLLKIQTSAWKTLSNEYHTILSLFQELYQKCVYEFMLNTLFSLYYTPCLEPAFHMVTSIDLFLSYATIARKYKYCCPQLAPNSTSSCFRATELRHPILERLTWYKSNSITLDDEHHYLLYGVNSSGKSSLLKSIACTIIMAQAGMFVPCTTFTFTPFTKLFTRTGTTDNLFLHHSSFVHEMRQVKQIVTNADASSLVIADELCASTEIDSSMKIVSSLIAFLIQQCRSKFIFATHLLELHKTPLLQIANLSSTLHHVHLKVSPDPDHPEQLLFDRVLSEGLPEMTTYGVLIAKQIIRHSSFTTYLNSPFHSTSTLSPSLVVTKKSRYHPQLIMEKCAHCGYQPQNIRTDMPLETHHIQQQCTADANGYIGHHHKNELHNLIVLCRSCHQQQHHSKYK